MKVVITENLNCMAETTALTGFYCALLYMGSQFVMAVI
jgi:hypothetical protein